MENTEVKQDANETADAAPVPPVGYRRLEEIIADLKKPIHASKLKQRKQGGNMLTYIPWYHAVGYLDKYAPDWSYEITTVFVAEGMSVMTVSLTIPTMNGPVTRFASGTEDLASKSFGDPISNAESMALRRACAKFGLGLYLYDKDKK